MVTARKTDEISICLWLYIPVTMLLLIIFVAAFFPSNLVNNLINHENGVIELSTVLVLIPGVIFGLFCIKQYKRLPNPFIVSWFLVVTLACIYFAGEEISWGQHLFGWDTPMSIIEINKQQETNLHNMSSWFNQKPRVVLELWVLVGGVCVPIFIKLRGISCTSENWHYWFWPPMIMFPTAILTILVRLPERLNHIFDVALFNQPVRYSEVQEFYFAYFLALYLLVSCNRLIGKK